MKGRWRGLSECLTDRGRSAALGAGLRVPSFSQRGRAYAAGSACVR